MRRRLRRGHQPVRGRFHADTPLIVYPPAGAPNVVVVLLDDVGFGAASTFGGPVPTPALDRVAGAGFRYNQFHTTALCSPTRAALLTGRNHHSAHMGTICEIAYGFPGYDSVIPQSTATVAQMLRTNGYNTALFGKAHFTPTWETGPAGPSTAGRPDWASSVFTASWAGTLRSTNPHSTNRSHPLSRTLAATTTT